MTKDKLKNDIIGLDKQDDFSIDYIDGEYRLYNNI